MEGQRLLCRQLQKSFAVLQSDTPVWKKMLRVRNFSSGRVQSISGESFNGLLTSVTISQIIKTIAGSLEKADLSGFEN